MASDKGASQEKTKKRSRVKETFGELKKVTWPTFGKTMKQTGAVFLVTIFFLVILLIMDQLLGLAHRQLITGLTDTESAVSLLGNFASGVKNACYALFSAPTVPLL